MPFCIRSHSKLQTVIVTKLPRSILQSEKIKPLSSIPSLLDLRSWDSGFVPSSQGLSKHLLSLGYILTINNQWIRQLLWVTSLEHLYRKQLSGSHGAWSFWSWSYNSMQKFLNPTLSSLLSRKWARSSVLSLSTLLSLKEKQVTILYPTNVFLGCPKPWQGLTMLFQYTPETTLSHNLSYSILFKKKKKRQVNCW